MGKVPTKQREKMSGRHTAAQRNANIRTDNRTAQRYRSTNYRSNYDRTYYDRSRANVGSYSSVRETARRGGRYDVNGSGYYDSYGKTAPGTYVGNAYRSATQTYDRNIYRSAPQTYDRNTYRSAPQSYDRNAYRGAEPRAYDRNSYGAYAPYPTAPAERSYGRPEAPAPERRILTREERLANKRKFRARLKVVGVIAFVFMLSAILIYRQTAIFGKNRQIESLNSELSGIVVTNEGIQSTIDRSIELGNLETFAKNRLGMINPDSSQIIYIDMGAGDEVVKP